MKTLRRWKRKFLRLVERIKLSESDYLNMKEQSRRYGAMMSTIEYNVTAEYDDVLDKENRTIISFPKSKTMTVNIDIEKILAAGGIVFDKNAVTLNVTGF